MKLATTSIFKNLKGNTDRLIELDDEKLEQLKRAILEIAVDVIGVCEKYGISYHLTGGTALGAVRHGGFIPWDDDLDIDMERKDLDKFLKIFGKLYRDKYWIHCDRSSEQFCIPCVQIRRKGTVCRGVLDPTPKECGIYIDIAIIENTFDNPVLRKIHGLGSLALGLAVSCRRFFRDRKYLMSLSDDKEVRKVFSVKIMIGALLSPVSLRTWTRLYSRWNSMCRDNSSEYVTVATGRNHFFGEMYRRKDFCEYTRHGFEGHNWRIPKEYDAYLTHMYGDYMKIPKETSREKHVLLDLKFIKEK